MPIQQFTLIVEGADLQSEPVFDALFEAGCDDATVARVDGVQYIDFDRNAASPGEAILSAVRDVKSVAGLRVTRVANLNPVSKANIADREPCTLDSVGLFVTSAPGPIGFPSPVIDPHSPYRLAPWSDLGQLSQPGSANKQRNPLPSSPQSTQSWNFVAISTESLRPAGTVFGL